MSDNILTIATQRNPAPGTTPTIPPSFTGSASSRALLWLGRHLVRGKEEVHAGVGLLTPELAALLLSRNPDNRTPSPAGIALLEEIIRRGDFQLNGETIVVSKCGWLNDGAHRCRAVVNTGTAIKTVFVFGVERDSRMSLGQGYKRTLGHVFDMKRVPNSKHVATAVRVAYQYESGMLVSGGRVDVGVYEQWYDAHPDIQEHVGVASRIYKLIGASAGLLAGMRWCLSQIDEAQAAEFFSILETASGMKSGSDPALRLRTLYLRRQKATLKWHERDQIAAIIKAWNMRRRIIPAGSIEWQQGEPFPVAE